MAIGDATIGTLKSDPAPRDCLDAIGPVRLLAEAGGQPGPIQAGNLANLPVSVNGDPGQDGVHRRSSASRQAETQDASPIVATTGRRR
jgi:hypothetical protein